MKDIKEVFGCTACNKVLKSKSSSRNHFLKQHFDYSAQKGKPCDMKIGKINYHNLKYHTNVGFKCTCCLFSDSDLAIVEEQLNTAHKLPPSSPFSETKTAFNRRLITFQKNWKLITTKQYQRQKLVQKMI